MEPDVKARAGCDLSQSATASIRIQDSAGSMTSSTKSRYVLDVWSRRVTGVPRERGRPVHSQPLVFDSCSTSAFNHERRWLWVPAFARILAEGASFGRRLRRRQALRDLMERLLVDGCRSPLRGAEQAGIIECADFQDHGER